MDITSKEMTNLISNTPHDGAVVLVHAGWCGHCVRFIPTFKKDFQVVQNKYMFEISPEYGTVHSFKPKSVSSKITSYPTVLFIHNGNVGRFVGNRNDEKEVMDSFNRFKKKYSKSF